MFSQNVREGNIITTKDPTMNALRYDAAIMNLMLNALVFRGMLYNEQNTSSCIRRCEKRVRLYDSCRERLSSSCPLCTWLPHNLAGFSDRVQFCQTECLIESPTCPHIMDCISWQVNSWWHNREFMKLSTNRKLGLKLCQVCPCRPIRKSERMHAA